MAERPSDTGSRIAGNALALLAARLTTGAATLVVSPFLFATLGARQFGVWALLVGTLGIAGLADLGFGSAQVREVARAAATGNLRRARGALALGLLFYAALGLVVLAGVVLGWPLFARLFHLGVLAPDARKAALLLAVSFLVDGLASPWRAALEGTQRMLPIAVVVAATTVLGSALGAALAATDLRLVGLGWAAVAASTARAALLVGAARRYVPEANPSLRALSRGQVRPLLSYGLRVQASNGAAALNNDTDRLVLGGVFSAAVVAPFDLGVKLANFLRIVPWYALAALFPAAATLDAREERGLLDRLYLRATRYLALFACLCALVFALCADPLVRLWLGRPLPFAATTIALLAVAYGVNVLSGAAAAVTRAEGTPGRETRYAFVTAGLNAALTFPLLLALGAVGVPLATTIAYALGTAFFFWHFHRASSRPFLPLVRAIWKPIAAAALAAALTWAAKDLLPDPAGRSGAAVAVACRAGLATFLAAAALSALRFLDDDDRFLLRRLRAGIRRRAPVPFFLPLPAEGGRGR